MKHYLVFVEDDIEPTVLGHFKSEDSRDEIARGLRKKHGPEHGLFPLDIDSKGMPKMYSYSGGFFDEEFMKKFEGGKDG